MTLLLDEADVRSAVEMKRLIEAVREGLEEEASGRVVMPPRVTVDIPGGILRFMVATLEARDVFGFKEFHGSSEQGVRYLVALYELRSGDLLALMDASYLTAARTGATTGIATKFMANPVTKEVAVLGAGLEAEMNLLGVCSVRSVERVRVYSPRRERREHFADEMAKNLGIEVQPIDTPEECVEGANLVVVATNTSRLSDPIAYRGAWMQPGVHVNAIGSTTPQLREIDPSTFGRADRIVVDSAIQATTESGDVIAAMKTGSYSPDRVSELRDVVSGRGVGRKGDHEVTLFKSVGTAIQDVAAAFSVYESALALRRGRDVGRITELKRF